MSSFSLQVFLLLGFLMSSIAGTAEGSAQKDGVQANVAISVKQSEEIWMGQQIGLNIDLKTTGFSFSDTTFNMPEVSGAFLMQVDTTTVKMTENIDGQSWQIIRYPLALFPQKSGLLEIPPITVRFSSARGFGSEQKAFEFQTSPLKLNIQAPPGVKEGEMVITTTAFKLEYEWQPNPQEEITTAQTGDAFTLAVKRSAGDISAILLPPLPVYRVEGLAAYPQAAEVDDKTSRGSLTGERSDKIIWVAEKPGEYSIPGIRFQWWDPIAHELKQQVIPGIKLDVQLSPGHKGEWVSRNDTEASSIYYIYLIVMGFVGLFGYLSWLYFMKKVPDQVLKTERSAFRVLQKACKNNHAGEAYLNLNAWLELISPATATLKNFSEAQKDERLTAQLIILQEALVTVDNSWQGSGLLTTLGGIRSNMKKQNKLQSNAQLAELNP